MNFLVLGDGPEEQAWAQAVADHPEHQLWAAYPGFKALPDLPGRQDLDEALATADVEAAIVGGPPEFRSEALRRVAAQGLPAICLHPPGEGADPYYQVALSRQETGAIILPDLPARLHPGVNALRQAIEGQEVGPFRTLRYEAAIGPADGELIDWAFPRVVDVLRALLGEIEAITATGEAAVELLVVLRAVGGRRGEIRLWSGPAEPSRLVLTGERGSLALEFDPDFLGPSLLVHRTTGEPETTTELAEWDRHQAMLDALSCAVAGQEVHPDLVDGTRTLELAAAAARSLRRGRTIDLHYEEISESNTFMSVMTSMGCALLLIALVALPVALVGPAFGMAWTLYLAYLIPPVLILFLFLQVFRLAVRKG